MAHTSRFNEVLEAIESLSLDDQEVMIDLVHRRLSLKRREELIKEIEESQREYLAGECQPRTVAELKLMREILS